MEKLDRPVDYSRLTVNICSTIKDIESNSLTSLAIKNIVDKELGNHRFQSLLPQGRQFLDETKSFFYQLAEKVRCLEDQDEQFNHNKQQQQVLSKTNNTTTNISKQSSSTLSSKKQPNISITLLRKKLATMSSDKKAIWMNQAITNKTSIAYHEAQELLRDNTQRKSCYIDNIMYIYNFIIYIYIILYRVGGRL